MNEQAIDAQAASCNERAPARFIYRRTVQFPETDLAGVVHFANYFRYMEEAEHAFWRSLGMSIITQDGDRELHWPRVSASCKYSAPAKFEDCLDIVLEVAEIGTRSVTYDVEIRRDSERIASGRTRAACCAIVDGVFETVDIPAGIRAKLSCVPEAS